MSERANSPTWRWASLAAAAILLAFFLFLLGSYTIAAQPATIAPSNGPRASGAPTGLRAPSIYPWQTGAEGASPAVAPQQAGYDLSIGKGQVGNYARPGGVVVYRIYYSNNGESIVDAQNVTIVDEMPGGTSYAGDTSPFTAVPGVGNTVSWAIGDLAPGDEGVIVVTLDVGPATPGPEAIEGTCATISSTTADEWDPGNNEACAGTVDVWDDEVEIGVDKWAEPGDPHPGETFRYVVNWCNHRGAAAGPVTLTDTLPSGTTLIDWEHQNWRDAIWREVSRGEELVLEAPGLPGDWCQDLYLYLELDSGAVISTNLENLVVVAVADDVDLDNNWRLDTDAHVSDERPDLAVDKWLNGGSLVPGGWIEYGISFWNQGNVAVTALLSDTLPDDAEYEEGSAWMFGEPFPPIITSTSQITWDLGTVDVTAYGDFSMRVQITDTATPGTYVNCAEVVPDVDDTTPDDNSHCVDVEVFPSGPNLRVHKWHNWNWEGQLGYQIRFENIGDQIVYDVWLTDTLPSDTHWSGWWQFQFDDSRLNTWDHISGVQESFIWNLTELHPGESGWIYFDANLDYPGEPMHWYTNTIEITQPIGDPSPADNIYQDVAFSGGEVRRAEFWLEKDGTSSMWGESVPGTPVTVTTPVNEFYAWADPDCGGCWNIDDTGQILPGDTVEVRSAKATLPVIISIPDPIIAEVDTELDRVYGEIGGWSEQPVEVHGEWDNGFREVTSEADGTYLAQYPDIPPGARGYVRFMDEVSYAQVIYHRPFQAMDLVLQINYDHDWIEGDYEPGHTVWITVTESDGTTEKATAELTTQEVPWWGGRTGFSTNDGEPWVPERPDIQPGDWVFARVSTGYDAEVRVGKISGAVNAGDDSIEGTVDANWLPAELVDVECHTWGAPEGTPNKWSTAGPDGDPPYFCQWDPLTEWDVIGGQQIAVSYYEPDGHQIYAVFEGPAMRVNYGHDWVGGNYPISHTFRITVTNEDGTVTRGIAELESNPWEGWSGPGFETQDEDWLTGRPDIQPYDWVEFRSDDGYTNLMQVGEIAGTLDIAADRLDGNVYATWFTDPLYAQCGVWEENGPGTDFMVDPHGGEYHCDFTTTDPPWDLLPGHTVGVQYQEPDGDWVINTFQEPSPDLQMEKWSEGSGQILAGGVAVFSLRVRNQGDATADTVIVTDTLSYNATYAGDSASVDPDTSDPSLVVWTLGPLEPGNEVQWYVYLEHTGDGDAVDNAADAWALYDNDPWNNHAEASVQVVDEPINLYVSKNPNPGDPAPGETMLWQIDYGNDQPAASGHVVLSDTIPAGTTIVDWWSQNDFGWEEQERNGRLILDAPSIPGHWGDQLYVQLELGTTLEPGTQLTNTVEIITDGDANPEDNWHLRDDVWVGEPRWDARVEKDFGWGTLVPGGEAEYNINVRNDGNAAATFTLIDELPEGTTFDEAWDCTAQTCVPLPPSLDGQTATWNLGIMEPGEWLNLNVRAAIAPDVEAGTVLTNCAEVTIDQDDGWPDNNHECVVETVHDYGPNLRIDKYYQWNWEGQLEYTIEFRNLGSTTLYDVEIVDTLPTNTSLDPNNWSTWFWEGLQLTDPSSSRPVWTISRLDPTWSSGLRYQVDLDSSVVGAEGLCYTNAAEAPIDGDLWPDDNYDAVTACTGPDIFAEKWLSGGEPRPGEIVTFTIKFGNQSRSPWDADGNSPPPPTTIADTLPEAMTFITATAPWDPEQGWQPYDIVDNTIYWGLWPMWSDSWWQSDVVVQISDTVGFGDVLTNTVEAWSNSTTDIDPLPDNNIAKLRLTILAPDLAVSKTYDSNRVAGTVVTYTLSVANDGNAEATGAVLSDTLPAGLTYLDSDGSFDGTDVTWSLAAIAPGGGTAEGWFSAELPCQAGESIANDTYGVVSSDQGVGAWGETVSFTTVAPTIQVSLDHSPEPALVDEAVSFVATASSNGTGLTYEWDFGAGPVSGGLTNSYTFAEAGSHEVSFTATDACGFSQEAVTTVQVEEGLHMIYLPTVLRNR